MESEIIKHKNIYYPPGGILIWMLIFLELFTFGIAIIAMVYYGKQEAELFHASRLKLHTGIGTINTIVLLTSGFFMAKSAWSLKAKETAKANTNLNLTMLGGVLFLLIKSGEYYFKIEAGLTVGYNTFFTFYWMLTLFHVIHILVGLVILLFIKKDIKKETNLEDVEASAAFWHMCDLIWLILFPILYLYF